MSQRLLQGEVVDDTDDLRQRIADLERDLRHARSDLAAEKTIAEQSKQQMGQSIAALRRVLTPLHRALLAIFGEIDAAGIEDVPASSSSGHTPTDARTTAVWAAWKTRLGGSCAKVIDALILHGDMNTQQLAIATGLHRTTIPKLIYEINKAGLLNKAGGRFSLKTLP